MAKGRNWKLMGIGILITAGFFAIRWYLTGKLDEWMLGVFDTMIGIFGGGVLLYILSELIGRAIINRLSR
jgi:hypothetical protein